METDSVNLFITMDDSIHESFDSTNNTVQRRLTCGEIILIDHDYFTLTCNFCGSEMNMEYFSNHLTNEHKITINGCGFRDQEDKNAFDEDTNGGNKETASELEDDEERYTVTQQILEVDDSTFTTESRSVNREGSHTSCDERYEECESLCESTGSTQSGSHQVVFEVELLQHGDVVKHMRSDDKNKEYQSNFECEICKKNFESALLLAVHMKRHTKSKSYPCEYCDACFMDSCNLKVHVNRHLGIKPHACPLCGKCFVSTTELKLHIRAHTGEKPYECEDCGKKFTHSGHLKAHRLRHSNIRPHECETCGKRFYDRRLLREHIAAHSDVRSFTCDTCGVSFTRHKALNEHLRLHSGVKKYECKICLRTFAQNAGLWSHKKQHVEGGTM